MPVFTAFGWAGEETALEFALTQLELFAKQLRAGLSMEAKGIFLHDGIDKLDNTVYLASAATPADSLQLIFEARPMALKMTLALENRESLKKGLKSAEADAIRWHRALVDLAPDYSLRVQQMEYNPDTKEATHYSDEFKDGVAALTPEKTAELLQRMAYLNNEDKWLSPIYLSRSFPSEFVAAMASGVVDAMAAEIDRLLPIAKLLVGPVRKARKSTSKAKAKAAKKDIGAEIDAIASERFSYKASLKPLHLRKGFVNLTAAHWPFFAINSRTTTRPVTIYYAEGIDKEGSVWRLVQNGVARVVLGTESSNWLSANCAEGDNIEVIATKAPDNSIDIQLKLSES